MQSNINRTLTSPLIIALHYITDVEFYSIIFSKKRELPGVTSPVSNKKKQPRPQGFFEGKALETRLKKKYRKEQLLFKVKEGIYGIGESQT